jgi:hypothetical protein
MKTRILFSLFAIAGLFLLNSCEDDLLDITEDFYYEQEIQVFTTDSVMTSVVVVDMADYEELIEQYGDKIKDIEISEVKYWLTTFEGYDDQEIIISNLKVANEDGSDPIMIAEIANQNLLALVDTKTELPINQAGLDKMADLIEESPHIFQLIYDTQCNKAPLNFTIKFQFKVALTANPLN